MISQLIDSYYRYRNLVWPTTEEALMWAHTEIGEVYELILVQQGGWIRNNPAKEKKLSQEEFDERLAEELGDVIMMLQVAGQTVGLNPLGALAEKIADKLYNKGYDKAISQYAENSFVQFDPNLHNVIGVEVGTGRLVYDWKAKSSDSHLKAPGEK